MRHSNGYAYHQLAADEPTLLRVLELQQTASRRQHESAAAAVAALPFEELSPVRVCSER
jgi:hypothetical protein